VEKEVSDHVSAETVPKKPHVVNSTDKPTEETPGVVVGNVESTETEVPKVCSGAPSSLSLLSGYPSSSDDEED